MGPIQKKWIESLRAHPERQTTGRLGYQTNDGYMACCLGEAALVVGTGKWRRRSELDSDHFDLHAGDSMEHLDEETTLALGLRGDEGDLKESFEKGVSSFSCLASMNDQGWSWLEIADYIEANPDNVFEREV